MRLALQLAVCTFVISSSALGQFADPVPLTSTATRTGSLVADDIDGDGHQDLIAAASFERALVLFVGLGDETFAQARTLAELPFEASSGRRPCA